MKPSWRRIKFWLRRPRLARDPIERCRWVHTLGMRFSIDLAFVDAEGTVMRTARMHRHRVGMPVLRAKWVIEAEAGAFGRWGLHVGDVVEFRE